MISAVIMAAGYSSRMGKFKPLLPVGGIPALERLADSIKAAGIKNIAIVTGYNREALQPVISRICDGDTLAVEAYNPDFDNGMFTSIQTGIRTAGKVFGESEGFFLIPVDCPLINSKVITTIETEVRSQIAEQNDYFAVPVYEGKKGHPLYVPVCYAEEICSWNGPGGLKGITDKYWDKMMRIPVDDEGCLLDMDTPQSYDELERFLAAGCKREDIADLAAGRRIVLVRHGQTQQHDQKMFIGQYDVPLNSEGQEQIKKTAQALSEMGLKPERIYCSDLSRAVTSAELIADELYRDDCDEAEVSTPDGYRLCPLKELREINLGAWDGQPVRTIKERFPEEYERRGKDIFVFKTGNKSENFYDLQYRAVKAMRKILTEDRSRDVVVVTHSGVVRSLENNLKGLRVDDEWKSVPKGDFVVIEK